MPFQVKLVSAGFAAGAGAEALGACACARVAAARLTMSPHAPPTRARPRARWRCDREWIAVIGHFLLLVRLQEIYAARALPSSTRRSSARRRALWFTRMTVRLHRDDGSAATSREASTGPRRQGGRVARRAGPGRAGRVSGAPRDGKLLTAQQLVDRGLGARLPVDPLDDHRAVEAVAAVGRGQGACDHDRAGRHAALQDAAGGALVDAGALPDEHPHGDHRARFDHDALADLPSRPDEAVG